MQDTVLIDAGPQAEPEALPSLAPSGEAAASIGLQARQGSVWLVAATGAAKAVALLSQLVLAAIMPRQEFTTYAIAISLVALLSVLRDGGLPTVLIQKKGRRFDLYSGPVFWMMLAINTATGLALAAAARPAAWFYQQPELSAVIGLFALSLPLCVPASLLSLRLTSAMRFTEFGIVQVASTVIRNALMLLFAWEGLGAKSFVLPTLFTYVLEALLLWYLTRCAPWKEPVRVRYWPKLMRSGRWVLLGTFSFVLTYNGAYFLMAKVVPGDVVASYFFAFQLITLLATLLANNAYQVLFAAFSRIATDTARLRAAILRSLGPVVLVGSLASLAIAIVFRPVESLLWHGKWATASDGVTVLAIVWPASALASVLYAVQAARGKFRLWGAVAFVSAVASILGSVAGALVGQSTGAAAIGYGIGTVAGLLLNARTSLRPLKIRLAVALQCALRPWLAIMCAAVLAFIVGRLPGNALLELVVSLICFGTLSFVALRLIANESLRLVLESVRHSIPSRLLAAPRAAITARKLRGQRA